MPGFLVGRVGLLQGDRGPEIERLRSSGAGGRNGSFPRKDVWRRWVPPTPDARLVADLFGAIAALIVAPFDKDGAVAIAATTVRDLEAGGARDCGRTAARSVILTLRVIAA